MHSRNSCKTLKCPRCNWHYKYQETLEIHMKEKHPENELNCLYCLTNQQHPRLARGETYTCGYKPYRCEVCNYSTTTKGNLSIHMTSDKHMTNIQQFDATGASSVATTNNNNSSSPTTNIPTPPINSSSSPALATANSSQSAAAQAAALNAAVASVISQASALNTHNSSSASSSPGSSSLVSGSTLAATAVSSAAAQTPLGAGRNGAMSGSPLGNLSLPMTNEQLAAALSAAASAAGSQANHTGGLASSGGGNSSSTANLLSQLDAQTLSQISQSLANHQQQQQNSLDLHIQSQLQQLHHQRQQQQQQSQLHLQEQQQHRESSSSGNQQNAAAAVAAAILLAQQNPNALEDYINSQEIAKDSYDDATRKFKCHRCKVAFTRQSYLTAHNKTLFHRKGEKLAYPMEKYLDPNRPFKCEICKESFTQKSILLVHNNSVSHLNKLRQNKKQATSQALDTPQQFTSQASQQQQQPQSSSISSISALHSPEPQQQQPLNLKAQLTSQLQQLNQSMHLQQQVHQQQHFASGHQLQQQQQQLAAALAGAADPNSFAALMMGGNPMAALMAGGGMNPHHAAMLPFMMNPQLMAAAAQAAAAQVAAAQAAADQQAAVQQTSAKQQAAHQAAQVAAQHQADHQHHQSAAQATAQHQAAQAAAAAAALSVQQQKRARTRISEEQLQILRQYFDINNSPTDDQLQEMSVKSELPLKVIKHWFRNTLFKERQKNKDSPYNFNNPPMLALNLEEYERTGEAKVTSLVNGNSTTTTITTSNSTINTSSSGSEQPDSSLTAQTVASVAVKLEPPHISTAMGQQQPEGAEMIEQSAEAVVSAVVDAVAIESSGELHHIKSEVYNEAGEHQDERHYDCDDLLEESPSKRIKLELDAGEYKSAAHIGRPQASPQAKQSRKRTGDKLTKHNPQDNNSMLPQIDDDNAGIGPSSTWSPLQLQQQLFDQTWATVHNHLDQHGLSSKTSDSSSHSINSSTNSKSKRANRTRFSDQQVRVLQDFFEANAYPKDDDLECLSKQLGLSPRVIVVWFQNARQKARKVYENRPTSTSMSEGDDDMMMHQQSQQTLTLGMNSINSSNNSDLINHQNSMIFSSSNNNSNRSSRMNHLVRVNNHLNHNNNNDLDRSDEMDKMDDREQHHFDEMDEMNHQANSSGIDDDHEVNEMDELEDEEGDNDKDNDVGDLSQIQDDDDGEFQDDDEEIDRNEQQRHQQQQQQQQQEDDDDEFISGAQMLRHQHQQQQQAQQQQQLLAAAAAAAGLFGGDASNLLSLIAASANQQQVASSGDNQSQSSQEAAAAAAAAALNQRQLLEALSSAMRGSVNGVGASPAGMSISGLGGLTHSESSQASLGGASNLSSQDHLLHRGSHLGPNHFTTNNSSNNNNNSSMSLNLNATPNQNNTNNHNSTSSSAASQRDKRLRTQISPEQLDYLYQKYEIESNPSRKTLESIAQDVGLSKRVVQVWFQNTRARERRGQLRVSRLKP